MHPFIHIASNHVALHATPPREVLVLFLALNSFHSSSTQLTHCSRTQVIKFEQGRNLPKEFVQEERGVHKSFYRAEQQGSSSKQVSSSGMPREGFPMANESTTQRPPKMVSIRVHARTHQSMHTHAHTHTHTNKRRGKINKTDTHTHTHKRRGKINKKDARTRTRTLVILLTGSLHALCLMSGVFCIGQVPWRLITI